MSDVGARGEDAARRVAHDLAAALRVTRLHAVENVVCRRALEALQRSLEEALEDGPLTVSARRGRLTVNGVALGGRLGAWQAELRDALERLAVGRLRLSGRFSLEAVRALVGCARDLTASEPRERLRELAGRLAERVPPPAEARVAGLEPASRSAGVPAEVAAASRAGRCYDLLFELAAAMHADVRAREAPGRQEQPLRHVLTQAIDGLEQRPFAARLLALTASSCATDPLATHAAHTAILALAMGRQLGLTRAQLAELGFAAFHHDLGRAPVGRFPALPPAVVETPEDHVLAGLRLALAAGAGANDQLARLVVIHEHHRQRDGYPQGALTPPHPYSRLIAVADAFDAFECGAPWRPALAPAEALRALLADGRRHDPVAARLLADVLGPRPRGTIVELAGRAVGVILDGRGERPLVRRVADRKLLTPAPEEITGELPQETVPTWRELVVG